MSLSKKLVFIGLFSLFILLLLFITFRGANYVTSTPVERFERENPFNPLFEVEYSEPSRVGQSFEINLTLIPKNRYDTYGLQEKLLTLLITGWGEAFRFSDKQFVVGNNEYGEIKKWTWRLTATEPGIIAEQPCFRRLNHKSIWPEERYATKCADPIYFLIGENHSSVLDLENLPKGIQREYFNNIDEYQRMIRFRGRIDEREVSKNDTLNITYELTNIYHKKMIIKPDFRMYQLFALDVVSNSDEIEWKEQGYLYEKVHMDNRFGLPDIESIKLKPNETLTKTLSYDLSNLPYQGTKIILYRDRPNSVLIEGEGVSPGKYGIILRMYASFCYDIEVPYVYQGIQCVWRDTPFDYPQAYMPGRAPREISEEFQITVSD
ncbi:hypothetical protein BMS3Bbin16_01056 [archaeon BMS3Bbin16]|nr:hypothetical protein BMS3Bbin16_01056 [archaeon BMS3Bbin16]